MEVLEGWKFKEVPQTVVMSLSTALTGMVIQEDAILNGGFCCILFVAQRK